MPYTDRNSQGLARRQGNGDGDNPLTPGTLSTYLIICSPRNQGDLWIKQKRSFARTTSLIKSLSKPSITSAQAKKLDSVGLGYRDLEKLKSECRNQEEFVRVVKDRGINSKPLQEKLSKHFKLPYSSCAK